MVVVDPVRTETAELADIHLRLRPGTDVYLLTALAAILVQEDRVDHDWITAHTDGFDQVARTLQAVPVSRYCDIADVDEALLRATATRIADASSVAVFEDLGVQMNHHSTVVSYVEKLLWLLTGNFARPGAQYVPSNLSAIGRDRGHPFGEGPKSPVVGAPIISGLVPCNVIAEEILTDHPARYRGMLVESSNPAHSLADSRRMAQALESLELLVVIDVALTETARLADYILPAPTQFEKHEATFFNFDFPANVHHLRHPVLPPPPGVLPEPEIHARLVEAAGALTEEDYAPLRAAAAAGRGPFAEAFRAAMADPQNRRLAPVLLYRTLGPTLPDEAASAAVLWAAAHQLAMTSSDGVRNAGYGDPPHSGERLFDAIVSGKHGTVITRDETDASWRRLSRDRIELNLPELLAEVADLVEREPPAVDPDFPFVLSAGERRAFTANTIIRDGSWRKRDPEGRLRVSSHDAERLGLVSGDAALLTTPAGAAVVVIETADSMRPGHISLPNGYGLSHADAVSDGVSATGVAPNQLTSAADRDPWVGTPWHKHVPARLESMGVTT